MPLDVDRLARLAALQDAVVARGQVIALGGTGALFARRIATGRWQRVHPGIAVTHSGPIGWRSRAQAAVLHAGAGAALSHSAAAYLHGFVTAAPRRIEVSIPEARRVASQPGLVVHRRVRMPAVLGRPAVVRRAPTLLDLVAQQSRTDDIVGLVSAAIRAGTSAEQILAELASRARPRHGTLVAELLAEVADGVESPLEYRYHRDVERRHALPAATLQVRQHVGGRWIRADALYLGLGVRAELDGELAHPGGRTAGDVWRDNAVSVERAELTLRYRWQHVAGDPCGTAAQLERALHARGWRGGGRPCGPSCPVGRSRPTPRAPSLEHPSRGS